MDHQRTIQLLKADVESTVGREHVPTVDRFVAHAEEFGGRAGFAQRLADDVQQFFHDAAVHTTWPPCPRHPHHPLWFHEHAWCCDKDGAEIAPLGRLTADPA